MKSIIVTASLARGLVRITRLLASVVVLGVSLISFSVSAQLVGAIGVGDISLKGSSQLSDEQQQFVKALDERLRATLANTRKFTVLDYPTLEERVQSQGLTLQGFYDKLYKSTELSQAGLDYILTLDVLESGVSEKQRGQGIDVIGFSDISFRLLGVAHATQDFAARITAEGAVRSSGDDRADKLVAQNLATNKAVEKLVNKVLSVLHPIRVMMIDEDSVITLNYGAGVLSAGDTILIYPEDDEGRPLPLKPNGTPDVAAVASLQVIDTKKKFAKAHALDGFVELEKGQEGRVVLSAN